MNREHVSGASIDINAPVSKVWAALTVPEKIKEYFFGAEVISDWNIGGAIIFKGEFKGNKYEEKGILLNVKPDVQLQYTHWSNLEGIPDVPENYRIWTFDISKKETCTHLSVSEDNIPAEKKRRSDEFWKDVLSMIKEIVER